MCKCVQVCVVVTGEINRGQDRDTGFTSWRSQGMAIVHHNDLFHGRVNIYVRTRGAIAVHFTVTGLIIQIAQTLCLCVI